MRKVNAVISLLLILLFLIHVIAGGFQLFAVIPGGNQNLKILSRIMLALLFIHVIIGIKLTIDTLKVSGRTKIVYLKENLIFMLRRISGLMLIVLAGIHVAIFFSEGKITRLTPFTGMPLAASVLLAVVLLVHILSNIKPLLIALGISNFRNCIKDVFIIFSVILLLAVLAFIFYYFRWNIFWRYGK